MPKHTDESIRTVPPDADLSKFPEAVAARIGDRDLWIADSGGVKADNLAAMGLTPNYVVSVNKRATDATTDHHPLKDAYINEQEAFTDAVEAARKRLGEEGTVIVNCAAGVSRSATIIATALAAEEAMTFDAAVEEIRGTRERSHPHTKLQLSAQAYLATVVDRSEAHDRREALADRLLSGDYTIDYTESDRIAAADALPDRLADTE